MLRCRAHLFGPGWEELESVKRPSGLLKLFDQLHSEANEWISSEKRIERTFEQMSSVNVERASQTLLLVTVCGC